MTAPVVQSIETPIGRAVRISPDVITRTDAAVEDAWLLTVNADTDQWQAILTVRKPGAGVGSWMRMCTHYVFLGTLSADDMLAPMDALGPEAEVDAREIYMRAVNLREGHPQAVRLARILVRAIMDGHLDPAPHEHSDLAAWTAAISVAQHASLSPEGLEYAEIGAIKRAEDGA